MAPKLEKRLTKEGLTEGEDGFANAALQMLGDDFFGDSDSDEDDSGSESGESGIADEESRGGLSPPPPHVGDLPVAPRADPDGSISPSRWAEGLIDGRGERPPAERSC